MRQKIMRQAIAMNGKVIADAVGNYAGFPWKPLAEVRALFLMVEVPEGT